MRVQVHFKGGNTIRNFLVAPKDRHNSTPVVLAWSQMGDNLSIVGRETHNITRTIKEAMYIRINDPSLNRNIGKFQFPCIWNKTLLSTPALHLK